MTAENLALFIVLALVAEILGTVGGFGSSIFFVPVASFFLDFYSVLGITAIFHVSSNISKIALFREGFDKKLVIRLGIPAVIFVIIGAYLSSYINTKILELCLAFFLIAISILLFFSRNLVLKPTWTNSIIGGSLSGGIAGLLGTGGALRGALLAAFNLEKMVFIATSAIIDLGIDVSRSVVYVSNGFVHWHDAYLIPILLVVSIIGTYLGKLILKRVSQENFKSLVLGLIVLVGIALLAKHFFNFNLI